MPRYRHIYLLQSQHIYLIIFFSSSLSMRTKRVICNVKIDQKQINSSSSFVILQFMTAIDNKRALADGP